MLKYKIQGLWLVGKRAGRLVRNGEESRGQGLEAGMGQMLGSWYSTHDLELGFWCDGKFSFCAKSNPDVAKFNSSQNQ